ncbi:MAG: EpsG family protein [Thermodesulfobacteriaceae bacterium]|jgi:hypothetical protein
MSRDEVIKASQRVKAYNGFSNHIGFLSNFMFWTTALILILIAGLRPIGLDRDSIAYANAIQSYKDVNLVALEPAFWVIKWFNDIFFNGNVRTFFLIYAILGVSIKFLAIKRLSKLPWLSVGAYLSSYFILHEMTQIRVGVAAGLFLLSIPDIHSRNFRKFIIKALLAISFHYSAIIMLPLYFLHPKKLNIAYFLLPIVGLISVYVDLSKPLLSNLANLAPNFLAYKINIYLTLLELGEHSEINIVNFHYTSLLLLTYFGFFLYIINKIKNDYDVLFLKIFALSLFSFYFFSDVPVFAYRISQFLNVAAVIFVPNFILYFKQKELIFLLVILFLLLTFYKSLSSLNL